MAIWCPAFYQPIIKYKNQVKMKSLITIACLLFTLNIVHAQSKLTNEDAKKDSVIIADIIGPAVQEAQGEAPDWNALTTEIEKKYDVTFADRTITKSIIYFSWNKNWPVFTAAIVKYTEKYEDFDNLKLLNKNANFILTYSNDQKELQRAQGWSKHTVEKDPSNADYKKTYDELTKKLTRN